MAESSTVQLGMILFDKLTQLDLSGPYEVLARVPGVAAHLVAGGLAPVRSDTGLAFIPTVTFEDCPALDIVCVPGGPGVNEAVLDSRLLDFIASQAEHARYVTSVCSGALVLGAAGLLAGRRATTHWASLDFLPAFGATPVNERICVDGNVITGGGVTAGIDFGLYLACRLAGDEVAQRIQLYLEYAPEPPFSAGSPGAAPAQVVAAYREAAAGMLAQRAEAVKAAARMLPAARSGHESARSSAAADGGGGA
jgi:cyclohexyl-isocyanide hydratase